MHESDFQSVVTNAIINQEADHVNVGLTENERAVVVEVGERDAAYTADEARELAQGVQCASDQRWTRSADDLIAYIKDLADVVDGDKAAEAVEEEWDGAELDQ